VTVDLYLAVSERDCARARRALSLVLDLEAESADVETLAVHLGECGGCRRYAAEVSAFTRALRAAAQQADDKQATRNSKGARS
jgi:predicted anti-sigma-YlaC factor YlaD